MKSVERSSRRAVGSFYTPDWITRWMVDRATSFAEFDSQTGFTIVDPACGDGAFVLSILDRIAARDNVSSNDSETRFDIIRNHVFGVDADPKAIEALRRRLMEWIGANTVNRTDIPLMLGSNFVCGDALLGCDWSTGATNPEPAALTVQPIDWRSAFPHVADAGGFDIVIGNPPYRRELNAKDNFARIAASTLGRRWRTARMDLWHYFFHRSLDLLKPGGRLTFIVNSYWTGSTASLPMRKRMACETSMEEIVLLGSAPLFRDVTGRHMIFRLRKRVDDQIACRILDLSSLSKQEIQSTFESPQVSNLPPAASSVTLEQRDVWHENRLRLDLESPRDDWSSSRITLGDVFEVRQGMAENPPFVTKSIAEGLGDPALKGSGVFVLTACEVEELGLCDVERTLLRPYFALSAIDRFQIATQPTHHVLYLTKETAPSLSDFPRIERHLQPYRSALLRRREVQNGKMAWWHLHWPREERLFTAPRVLCVQMSQAPRFVYVEQPTFVGFSLNLIVARPSLQCGEWRSLAGLGAILNSSRAKRWFESHAKQRGANLDISGTVLKRFPLPGKSCPDVEAELERLSRNWPTEEGVSAEVLLEELVERAYSG